VRPAHCGPNLAGGANRRRAHVLLLDRKCEWPFFRQHRELLRRLLGAAIAPRPPSAGKSLAVCYAEQPEEAHVDRFSGSRDSNRIANALMGHGEASGRSFDALYVMRQAEAIVKALKIAAYEIKRT
jgi:hypothetical protein